MTFVFSTLFGREIPYQMHLIQQNKEIIKNELNFKENLINFSGEIDGSGDEFELIDLNGSGVDGSGQDFEESSGIEINSVEDVRSKIKQIFSEINNTLLELNDLILNHNLHN